MVGYQDIASLVSGLEDPGSRWNTVLEPAGPNSVQTIDYQFKNEARQAALSGRGLKDSPLGPVAFKPLEGKNKIPDEERVERSAKTSRLARIAPIVPPRNFNAGSLFERTSLILRPGRNDTKMAFSKPETIGREVEIASAFHNRAVKKPDPLLPAAIAALVTNETPDILATAYAPVETNYAELSPFAALLREDKPDDGRFIPPLGKGDHAWLKNPLPPEVFSKKEQKCLATAIYFEARGETEKGQAAVAQVVLNRVRNPSYPDTICDVVYQNQNWHNRCQFSFACDGIPDIIWSRKNYQTAEEIALAVSSGKIFLPEIGSATHYHATYVNPAWGKTMHRMEQVGLHVFYRTYGGGWS